MAPTGVGRKQKSNLDDLQPNSSSHAKGVYKCL